VPAILHFNTDFTPNEAGASLATTASQTDYIQRFVALAAENKGIDQYVFYKGAINWNDRWDVQYFLKRVLSSDGLSDQVESALLQVFENEPGPVIALYAGTPELNPELVNEGFQILKQKDLVFSIDTFGSVNLVGMKCLPPHSEDSNIGISLRDESRIRDLSRQLNWSFQKLGTNTAAKTLSSEEGEKAV